MLANLIKNRARGTSKISNMTFEEFITNSGVTSTTVTRKTVMEDSAVASSVDTIASTLASMGLGLYKSGKNGSKERAGNSLDKLVSTRPNKNTNQLNFIRDLIKDLLLYQNAYAYVKTNVKGEVVSIERLDASVTTISRTTGTDKLIVETTYLDQMRKFQYEEVIHLQDCFDRFKAIEPVVEAKNACRELISSYFNNKGMSLPKGLLRVPGDISDQAKAILKQAFNKVLQSTDDGIAVVGDGLDFELLPTATAKSFQEQLIVELQHDLSAQIFEAFKVSPALISSDGQESSYASLQVIMESFVKSLSPYIDQIEQEFNNKCLSDVERNTYYFKLNVNRALRMNAASRMDWYAKAISNGIYTQAECRALEDLEFKEGTDVLLRSLNYVPLDKYDEYLQTRYKTNKEVEVKEDE